MAPPHAARLCATLLLLLFSPSLAATDAGDAAAMAALARSLAPLPSKWTAGADPDPCGERWEGVFCAAGRVTSMDLKGLSLGGRLPAELASLSSLRTLSFQGNRLGGPLPSLAGMADLRELYLGGNAFESVPPGFFSGLASLANVSLDNNPFAPWALPGGDLAECTALARFSAMNATVVGAIPDVFGALVGLRSLRLSYNYLVGVLPPSLGSPSCAIQELYLNNQLENSTTSASAAGGKLSGSLEVLGSMAELTVAWLHMNSFTGPVPDLSKCTSLVDLELRGNQLTGVLPPSLASLPNLRNLTLSNNLLQGPMPSLGKDVAVDATGNSFCNAQPGPCDQRVADLLDVAGGLGYPASLAKAWKGNDPCSGWLFVSCDPQGNITVISFGGQNFVGNISDSIARFGALKVLKLQNNSLTGSIPASLAGLAQLQLVDVSYNNLTGDIPAFGPNVKVITTGNPLLGSHTDSGGSSSNPSGSNSSPSGGSPSGGGSHSMSAGYIVLIALAVVAVIVALAGFAIFKWRHNRVNRLSKAETHNPPNVSEMVKLDIARLKGTNHLSSEFTGQNKSEYGNVHVMEAESMFVPIQDLQRATNNFSEGNILGRGGFGVVYKGEQPDGTLIAVKRMECGEMGKKGMGEFKAEIEVLRKVRHRHLVALLGYCEHGYEKLLVYEYMPQGTLAQHLFHHSELHYPPLSWKQRLTIALDVARGLEYLHSLAQTSFIHRDLKPSNILLDNNMRAKVSDFGLVKLAPDGKYSVETRLAGTFGYLAPEYATTGRVTTKVDVFAFGVVLMELISGRKALDESLPDESSHLVSWFRRVLINKDNITKAVDPNLELDDEDVKSVITVAELAGYCTSREAQQRPDMGHAVGILVPLVGQWKPVHSDEEDNKVRHNEGLLERLKRWEQNAGTSAVGFDFDSQYDMENSQGTLPTEPDMFPDGR